MANPELLKIIKQGAKAWNEWREENPEIVPNIDGAELEGTDLAYRSLRKVNFYRADLTGANLELADLREANLGEVNLLKADLRMADLRESNLILARLAETKLLEADLTGAIIWGVSAWGLQLEGSVQKDLVVSHPFTN